MNVRPTVRRRCRTEGGHDSTFGWRVHPPATRPHYRGAMLTTAAIQSLLIDMLTGAAGGTRKRWAQAVGAVTTLPLTKNPRSNWSVTPTGSVTERHAVFRAVELVRAEHPYCVR